jgi:hypothetical protein
MRFPIAKGRARSCFLAVISAKRNVIQESAVNAIKSSILTVDAVASQPNLYAIRVIYNILSA